MNVTQRDEAQKRKKRAKTTCKMFVGSTRSKHFFVQQPKTEAKYNKFADKLHLIKDELSTIPTIFIVKTLLVYNLINITSLVAITHSALTSEETPRAHLPALYYLVIHHTCPSSPCCLFKDGARQQRLLVWIIP